MPGSVRWAWKCSLALLGAGYPNPGAWPIKAGKYKGRAIETKQRKLANWLVRQLGQPEKFKSGQDAEAKIGARRGIVSFFNMYGDENAQGHIAGCASLPAMEAAGKRSCGRR